MLVKIELFSKEFQESSMQQLKDRKRCSNIVTCMEVSSKFRVPLSYERLLKKRVVASNIIE